MSKIHHLLEPNSRCKKDVLLKQLYGENLSHFNEHLLQALIFIADNYLKLFKA